MKQIRRFLLVLFIFVFQLASANEGMWLPHLLGTLNEKEMKAMGMKISAKDIYNINNGSLKDAIVSFGGFCTGEIISEKGLVLTNHHCGFDAIQNHSTLEKNYIRDGFWAKNNSEEIPNPGLFVTFIVRIDDVTSQVLNGVTDGMAESARQSVIDRNIAALKNTVKKEEHQDYIVRSFFEGNQYYLFVTETYRDVRLVGAPPSSIGNFGKDTDNWMWPRHTGDFSMFRIYADRNNKPASYSPDNIPYKPKRALAISMSGVKEGDFTMVFGFPGRTSEYLHSEAVRQIMEVNDPVKISIRDRALAAIDKFMRSDEQIKIQYASKWAGISNAWKKWQGEILGLKRSGAVQERRAYENEFQKRVNARTDWKNQYGTLLGDLEAAYKTLEPYGLARDYFTEIVGRVELFGIAGRLNALVTAYENGGEAGYNQQLNRITNSLEAYYGEYSSVVDKELFKSLMTIYRDEQPSFSISNAFKEMSEKRNGNISEIADHLYQSSILDDPGSVMPLLKGKPAEVVEKIKNDPAFQLFRELAQTFSSKVQPELNKAQDRINELQRVYMKAQMEVMKEKKFYPDANSTMRVTYGKINGYEPRDGVSYDFRTYLDGVMEKYVPGDYEFDIPEKLITLYKNKDYGKYGVNGKMPVCMIASNHTTGGNSGSPVIDAYGNLIGINFDRVWEGTMSDINYDPAICRNIMVDIRYILFIIDKFAGAGHLVEEMKLVGAAR